MIQDENKSKRYRQEKDKLNANKNIIVHSAEVKKMGSKQYTNYNIRPGMMTWSSMPDDYKQAYHDQHKNILKKRIEEKTATAAQIEEHRIQLVKDKELNERIKQMERRLLDKSKNAATTYINTKKKPGADVHIDNAVCNFIDSSFFKTRAMMVDDERTVPIKEKRKKVLLIADVCGWAWWNKSRYIQMYLKDEFEIDIICVLGPEAKGINNGKYDLYLTYGYSYVGMLQNVPFEKRITGITAHRPLGTIKSYMKLAKNLHANSRMLENELKGLISHDRVHYVPNGVDEHVFRPIKPIGEKKRLIAGHVGKKCKAKGQKDFIIPAMQNAKVDSITNMNDYRSRKPYCEMADFYQQMDVFVVASVEDGTPNGALEAAACGRPIISNRIGNMPEFIQDGVNGFLLDERNVNAYVERLNLLNNDRELLKKMGENARKTVESEWTWKHQAEGYRRMFKSIIG